MQPWGLAPLRFALFDCVFLLVGQKGQHISSGKFASVFESDFHRFTHTFWFDAMDGNGWSIL